MSSENLKFRVWDILLNRYRSPDEDEIFSLTKHGYLVVYRKSDHSYQIANKEHFIVERCTGFYDSKGTLIYQGDIIERYDSSFNPPEHIFRRAVFFNTSYACFYELFPGAKVRHPLDAYTAVTGKVVGNINENVDLLGLETAYGELEARNILASIHHKIE